jgi:DNA-binding response OmpR family regulator
MMARGNKYFNGIRMSG